MPVTGITALTQTGGQAGSCRVAADLDRLAQRYQMVNIKLDKAGGLTEAFDLLAGAWARGLGVMVGCMISTSLTIAAALRVAMQADCADLDGPLWLEEDKLGGIRMGAHGLIPTFAWLLGDQTQLHHPVRYDLFRNFRRNRALPEYLPRKKRQIFGLAQGEAANLPCRRFSPNRRPVP